MRISDWSSDVCSSDLALVVARILAREPRQRARLVIIFRLRFQSAGDVALRVVGRRRLAHIGLRRLGTARPTVNDQRRFAPRLAEPQFGLEQFELEPERAPTLADRQSTRLQSSHYCP